MKLYELKTLLNTHTEKQLAFTLPDGRLIPISFHVTEVGHVRKNFIDCGGKSHSQESCQLQVWLGADTDHRLSSGKLASILELANGILPGDDLDVEVEYEDAAISQYRVAGYAVSEETVTLQLSTKHTACLAPELCVVPSSNSSCGCGPAGCC